MIKTAPSPCPHCWRSDMLSEMIKTPSAEAAHPDIATAYTQAAKNALTWCGAAEPIWRTSTTAETLAIDISAASSVDLCFGQTGRPLTEEERALIVGALNAKSAHPVEGLVSVPRGSQQTSRRPLEDAIDALADHANLAIYDGLIKRIDALKEGK